MVSGVIRSPDGSKSYSNDIRDRIDVVDPIVSERGKNYGTSTVLGAGFNFVNSIVGAGIIGIPVAIKECGLFMGIIILLFVALLINRSTVLIIECGIIAKVKNLEELCRYLFGASGYKLATLFMFLYAYGAMIAYIVIIGDTVPSSLNYIIGEDNTPSKDTVMLIVATVFILPLSLLRDMSSLSVTSLLSITADILMILFICIKAQSAAKDQDTAFDPATDYTIVDSEIFAGIGTISFAFVCQHSSFIVFRSMKEQDIGSWKVVSNTSLFIASMMCFLLGIYGYMTFGSNVDGDILNNFSDNDGLIAIARLMLALTMVFTFPMECFVTRHALISLAVDILAGSDDDGDSADAEEYFNTYTIPYDVWASGGEVSDYEQSSVASSLMAASALGSACGIVDSVLTEGHESITDETQSSHSKTKSCDAGEGTSRSHVTKSVRIGSGRRRLSESIVEEDQELPVHAAVHIGVTMVLWTSSVAIAVIFGDLTVVLALTGSLAGSMLGYIIPAAIYFKTYEREWTVAWGVLYEGIAPENIRIARREDSDAHLTSARLLDGDEALSYRDRISCFFDHCEGSRFILPSFMMLFGVVAMVIGVGTVIIGLFI